MYTCLSDLLSPQMFYNFCKSSHIDWHQFNHQWRSYWIRYTICYQSRDTIVVMEKQELIN